MRREEERRSQKRKSQKKEDPGARKVGKSRNIVFLQGFVAPEGRKKGSLHVVVARSTFASEKAKTTSCSEHFWYIVEISKKCMPLWREAHFEVKRLKTHHVGSTFGNWDVEKMHAAVARSTCRSQNAQNTTCSRHFWRFRCQKSARRCGAKHISKSEVQKTEGSEHFLTFRCRFVWQAHGIAHLVKSEQNVKVLWHVQKRWQAWDIWRRSAKIHFPWQAQYKRHVHQSCYEVRALISWEELHFGASDLQVCWDDFAWQMQHFVWPGITFSWQAQ